MTIPVIAALTAAILAVLQVALMMPVGLMRGATSISLGDGGDEELLRRIRRHGNLIENAPMFLILLTLLELTGGAAAAVMGLAGLFVAARLSHALALSGPDKPLAFRLFGAMGTILSLLGGAGFLAWHVSGLL